MDREGRWKPVSLDDAMTRDEEATMELPTRVPIVRYLLAAQAGGTAILAIPLGLHSDRQADEDHGVVLYEKHYELVQQVKPYGQHPKTRKIPGLTKIYTDHIAMIEETDYELEEETE